MPQVSIYDSLFGGPAAQAAAARRDATFQDMLNARKKVAEQRRTDDARLARLNAFGNVLTTMVQPLGWIAGGKGFGTTGGVEPYDNRQYLEAFDRAVKAQDDLRNIGTMEGEYDFKIADDNYKRALALEDEARKRQYAVEDAERNARIWAGKEDQRQENRLEVVAAKGDVQKELTELRAKFRVTKQGISVDDRILLKEKENYEIYKRQQIALGNKPMSFEDYMKGNGYSVTQNQGGGSGSTGSSGGAKPEKKAGFQGTGSASTGKTEKKAGFVR